MKKLLSIVSNDWLNLFPATLNISTNTVISLVVFGSQSSVPIAVKL